MMLRSFVPLCLLLTLPAADGIAADGPGQPILRVEGDGPTAQVTALAFSPDGKTLYAAGYDKVVRFWTWDATKKTFTPGTFSYRVPIGPGLGGVLNALAVSPDGRWLAATGIGVSRGEAGFEEQGRIYPADALSHSMQQERATVYLFNTQSGGQEVYALRGPAGVGVALAFAPAHPDKGPLLVSATRDHETRTANSASGT
jgi:WD40 repeat protein